MSQQQELLQEIYSDSDLANVQYIEAHGTGTPVGDTTEARSISNIIAKAKPLESASLWIGSVKGNIGHTESAAGVAGLIKVLLMMKHETIVPSLFYSEDNSSIDVKTLGFRIPMKAEKWENNGSLERVAGINSFGFGGTNAHVIVKQCRQTKVTTQIPTGWPKLFVISAASEKSFFLSIIDTHKRLCSDPTVDFMALSYTSACRRSHFKHKYRKAFLISSLSDLKHQMALKAKLEPSKSDKKVIFVFCGNGIAYRGMCKQLLKEAPIFRDKVREVENLFKSHKNICVSEWLAGECDDDDFRKPNVVQPLLFAVQVGIVALLKHYGVKPDVVLGHSVGEVAAAHCSGLLSLKDAVKVLHHRSTLQSRVTEGKMLVVSNVAVEEVLKILPDCSGEICVAAFNSPRSCTLSGDADAIDSLHHRLRIVFREQNVFLHELDVPAAYHSHMMDPILKDIEKSIDPVDTNEMECKLISTVTGDSYCDDDDFRTGQYWARNIREPVLFEKALCAATQYKRSAGNVIFVEIGPRTALQRNILETLGMSTLVLSSVQPGRDYETIISTVAKLFELGINVTWDQIFKGHETLPTALPVYQFSNVKKELNFESVRKSEVSSVFAPHMLISQMNQDMQEYTCTLSLDTVPYLWEHKNNGVPIVPGALFVELAFASVMASLKPKKPVSFLQLSVRFESPLTLNSNCHQLKVVMQHAVNESSFKIQSSFGTHSSGTFRCLIGQLQLEEPKICLDIIYRRCKFVIKKEEIYSVLSQAGFEYGPVFKQLKSVHFGDEFREAVTLIRLPGEIVKQLHDYYVHPLLLDYLLQMTAVIAHRRLTGKLGFPSAIGSLSISGPLQEEMIIYLRATQETPDFIDLCGCFSTTDGRTIVELKGVRVSFLGSCLNAVESYFFHNEVTVVSDGTNILTCLIKAIVFEDKFGIAKALRPHMHPESVLVESREHWTADQVRNVVFDSLNTNVDLESVLFIWGVEDLSHLSSEKIVDSLVTCCELFRQVVLGLKDSKRPFAVYVITYKSTEKVVDHVSPGFVLSGMMRTCAAEMVGLSFHLIDLASLTREDIRTLVHAINTCKLPEVMISQGQASTTRIVKTPKMDKAVCEGNIDLMNVPNFALQTSDPYKMAQLTAISSDPIVNSFPEKFVEIQVTNICVHSYDYFPVTTSHLNYGETIYWNKHTSQRHKLLYLDFSGIITAVGKDISSLRVGDHVASCYPIDAHSKVVIPGDVCYSTKKFMFFKEAPCVSYFILSWEILQRRLGEVRLKQRKMVIVSRSPASALVKVLALTANRSGWNVSSFTNIRREAGHFDQNHAFVFVPPFEHSWQEIYELAGQDRHIIFVCSSHTSSSSLPANMFALRSENIHVHKLNVAEAVQRANLQEQNRNISKWLMSLGFDAASLPLKMENFQLSSTKEPQANLDAESYFTTMTVQQVALHQKNSECPVTDIPLLTRHRQLFQQNSVYIVTGGLSGLGLETVKFIAHNGGGCIATLSRSSASDKMRSEMELLKKRYGVRIMNVQCDVSVSTQVDETIFKIEQQFPCCPIKGVFHSAVVLHDALIETLDQSLFRKVLQPKVSGALNLHYATLHTKLDFFVCYSSISSFIGNPSQCNYAAANSFLDTFCHYRRNLGLAGQSINWGPLNLGLLLNKDHFHKFLEAKGMRIMAAAEIQEALEECLLMNRPQQVVCNFDFKKLNIHVLSQNASLRERLSDLVKTEIKDDASIEPKASRLSATHGNVRTIVCEINNISADELDDDSTLLAVGIDSMLAMTLQNRIFQEMGVNVPLVKLLDPNVTLATLEAIVMNST